MHDGSETISDGIILVAYAGEKESAPFKVHIVISPVNDEIPIVVNNTGATVWRGGICNITNSQLGAYILFIMKGKPGMNIFLK